LAYAFAMAFQKLSQERSSQERRIGGRIALIVDLG
jgi:hypothetical protein